MSKIVARPCFIISSARSGSKLLRELIMKSDEYVCYPYDINYIWMYGHSEVQHDELGVENVNTKSSRYVINYLHKLLKAKGASNKRILEKTVSNSLRLDYVLSIFPDAQIVHLIRDGREATISIKSCWMEPAYSEKNQSFTLQLEKLKTFPFVSSGPYLAKYVKNCMPKLFGGETLKSWGPRFDGIEEMLSNQSLSEVCANQWARSIAKTTNSLSRLKENEDYIEIKYEDLVSSPQFLVDQLSDFLKLGSKPKITAWALENIQANPTKWDAGLDEAQKQLVYPILKPHLLRYGYVK